MALKESHHSVKYVISPKPVKEWTKGFNIENISTDYCQPCDESLDVSELQKERERESVCVCVYVCDRKGQALPLGSHFYMLI